MMSSESEANRFSRLFDLAHDETAATTIDLSLGEREELTRIRDLLGLIDASWQVTDVEQERVRSLFLQKLAAREPDHPWVRSSTVRTLGELVRASHEDAPPLPSASYEHLALDPTPVEALVDPTRRTLVVGQAVRRAAVPQTLIGELMLWLNRSIAGLVPRPGPAQAGLLFTRRQGSRRGRTH